MASCFASGCEGVWWAGVLLSTCFSTWLCAAGLVVAGFAVAGAVVAGLAVAGLAVAGLAAAESVFTVFFTTLAGFSALTGAGAALPLFLSASRRAFFFAPPCQH